MINNFIKNMQEASSKAETRKQKMEDIKNYMDRKRAEHNGVKNESPQEEPRNEKKKKAHWLWDNKLFLILKTLVIIYLLIKALTIFWNEITKLIKAAKHAEAAMTI